MKIKKIVSVLVASCLFFGAYLVAKGPNGRPIVWADCEAYQSVVAPNELPNHGPFDQLYMNPAGFKDGVPLISESKPGDRDYNGGRWHVNILKMDVDGAKYADACSVEDLDLGDFEGTGDRFSCPLQPRRGQR